MSMLTQRGHFCADLPEKELTQEIEDSHEKTNHRFNVE